MKKTLFIFTFLIVVSCGNNKTEYVFDSEKTDNTNKIIQTLISNKNLNVFNSSIPVCKELIGNAIYEPIPINGIIKFPLKSISLYELMNYYKKKLMEKCFLIPKIRHLLQTKI